MKLLNEYECAFCMFELAGQITPKEVTTDFVYVRLHGPGGKYQGKYYDKTLSAWLKDFKKWSKEGKSSYCYFDNDDNGYAAENAITMNRMLKN